MVAVGRSVLAVILLTMLAAMGKCWVAVVYVLAVMEGLLVAVVTVTIFTVVTVRDPVLAVETVVAVGRVVLTVEVYVIAVWGAVCITVLTAERGGWEAVINGLFAGVVVVTGRDLV